MIEETGEEFAVNSLLVGVGTGIIGGNERDDQDVDEEVHL